MSVNTYYRDELAYLREMGKLFAQANPRLSSYLAKEASDPDVERLLEGFAFLVGRMRQRLDGEMPELAHSLLQLVWPHYLRPVPPVTTLAFRFAEGASAKSIDVPRGTGVQAVTERGEAIEFRTSYDLTVLPLTITEVDLENRKDSCRLTLTISALSGIGMGALEAGPLTLFFNGYRDVGVARSLFMFFMERLRRVEIKPEGGAAQVADVQIEPVGFTNEEATLPYPKGAFHGFRIMQEYFSCPEKFMYARIRGLERFADPTIEKFELSFEMSQAFPDVTRLITDHFSLNSTPAINLFEAEGQALQINHDRSEYPVRAVGTGTRSVHSVRTVTGWVQGSGQRIDYDRFERFRHDTEDEAAKRLYYRADVRPAVLGNGIDHYISFVTSLNERGLPPTETISLKLDCSNGAEAARLPIGAVNRPTSTTPGKLDFSNISPVMSEVPPPLRDRILWTLIANLARNFSSLIDVDALRTVISAYDFRANVDRQAAQQRDLLLQSFQSFERKGVDIVSRGRPVRAYELLLSVSENATRWRRRDVSLRHGFWTNSSNPMQASTVCIDSRCLASDSNLRFKWPAKWGEASAI